MLEKVDCSGWMDGWVDGWVDGWMGVKAGLRIAYSNQKLHLIEKTFSIIGDFSLEKNCQI